ncbi:HDOD domain-containing protein [Flocculibacter collagenilyticus]|uniref:HDOD domain-containing protein n=1 Tax=Flocculibacter collagenilyticus TaxID=2744479 RepID=UPI0018F3667C|nr:HDOD domain-containing protein [Flocculibacter collagenilyticus]
MSTENALLTILVEKINNDAIVLPTLPQIAVKVRQTADDPDVNLNQIGDVISQDPALSARMIKVANSAFMGRSVKVESLNQAVTRIGLKQIKNIVTAMAMEQLFESKNPMVKTYLDKSWQKTVDAAAVAITMLQLYLREHKHTSLNLDTITLAALVHNIGVLPILTEAENHEDVFANPEFIEQAIKNLAGKIGGAIMREWGFKEDFVVVAECWRDMDYQPDEVAYVDFVRLGAMSIGVMKKKDNEQLMQTCIEKGVISSPSVFEDDDFKTLLADVRSVFA